MFTILWILVGIIVWVASIFNVRRDFSVVDYIGSFIYICGLWPAFLCIPILEKYFYKN